METRRMAKSLAVDLHEDDDDDGYQHVGQKEQELDADLLLPVRETLEQQRSICEVLAPFASTYLAVAQALQILHRSSMLEAEFISFVINDISNKVQRGSCAYGERQISRDRIF